ncbi:NACHT, LRR and PYD domains-containing protein [Pimephales promelas]|nr:NACHT, LRR and PYD domains-containing protein [Pimephales promelas]
MPVSLVHFTTFFQGEDKLVEHAAVMSEERGKDSLSKMSLSEKQRERSGSPDSSLVSMKSDHSKDGRPPSFSEKTTSTKRSGSPDSSLVSMRSDHSKDGRPPSFSEKTTSTKSNKGQKTTVNIGAEIGRWKFLKDQKGMSSDVELASFLLNRIQYEKKTEFLSYRFKNFRENLIWVFQDLENKIIVFLKNELEKFKKILKKENTEYFVQDYIDEMCSIKEAALDITLHFLKSMKQDELADTLKDELVLIHQRQLKSNLKKKYQCVSEGIANQGDSTLLNSIYTDLYITQGGSEQVNSEHEVRQIEISKRAESQEIPIECTNLFESPEEGKKIRTVLTKGVAGIGKSVSVQKFILDWAEGKENQDISFIFPLPFREMNLKEKEKPSLMNLVSQFFPEIKGLNLTRDDKFNVLFILDGLDECRLPLNFKDNETWHDISSPASLDVLLTNLIRGNLLPSALVWITSRPAAASKIPPYCIDRVTEVRGFNDEQKQEYFRKRFTDEEIANRIIDHVKKSKSLFIMCHIPVFCWISATVLQNILQEKQNNNLKNQTEDGSMTLQKSNTEDIPKTLTQMYTHFLRFQIHQSRRKYKGEYRPDVSWDKDAILSLGKLAFHQLEKNNLIFYETDLKDCGIDASKASDYSGMCTQIFKEETGIIIGTMYCFVHMSIQEFIAALYAHLFLDDSKKSVFNQESTEQENRNETMIDLLKAAVDKALASDTGHLDLFLRFLLGLSLESNYPLVRGLLTQQDRNDQSNKDIVQYIKKKLGENLSPERSINLFYCLNELNDQTLVKDIQTQLREGSLSSADLSPAQWSAVAFVLLTSEEELEDFELEKFKKSDECLKRLSAVIKSSKRALLSKCDLTEQSCSALASVLSSDSSILKDLDLSNNNLQDSGVKLLCGGLKKNCKLEKLRLSDCRITEEGYKALASALRSNPSHLIELDLTGNDPGQSGVKELDDLLQDQKCSLKTLRFLSPAADKACQYVRGIVGNNPLLLRELNLSGRKLGDTRVNQIAALLQDKHCKLKTLMLRKCGLTEESCSALATVLRSNSSLKELDISNNNLQDSGVKKLQNGLGNTDCTLQKLRLSDCSITEEGYKALASALRSNPSHLIELDLTGNDPGQSGVKELDDLLQDQKYSLKTLRFLKSQSALEACDHLTKVLGKSPLILTELDLSEDKLGDLDGEKLSALLMDSHSKVEKIKLNNCDQTEKSCSVLATVLSSKTVLKELNLNNSRLLDSGVKQICEGLKNPVCELKILKLSKCDLAKESCSALASVLSSGSNLKDLDLSNNNLQDSGVKLLSDGLKENCKLERLGLSDCSITEEGYKALASALRSNPSHLIELDLTGNDPGQSGVKELDDLLQDQKYSLKTLRFLSPAADKACQFVRGIVGNNPLLLRELNLSGRKLGDTRVNQIAALLQDKHCKLNTLMLNNTSITAEGCAALTSAFNSNPSNLIELDLSENKLANSGIKKICVLLENTQCRLEKLNLSDCSITEEGYKALASALRSNPSHLIELDLTGNDPGQSGVKELDDLLQDERDALKTIRFLKSSAAQEACDHLTKVLGKSPLLLTELDLSEDKLGDLDGEKLSALLMDSHSKVEKIKLNNCDQTEKSCSVLATVLSSKTVLKELNLNNSRLLDSGVKQICEGLKKTVCQLKILKLSDCSISEEGYKALASALRSNPSHLIELDLTGNDPGQSGVKELDDLLQDQKCSLKTLKEGVMK